MIKAKPKDKIIKSLAFEHRRMGIVIDITIALEPDVKPGIRLLYFLNTIPKYELTKAKITPPANEISAEKMAREIMKSISNMCNKVSSNEEKMTKIPAKIIYLSILWVNSLDINDPTINEITNIIKKIFVIIKCKWNVDSKVILKVKNIEYVKPPIIANKPKFIRNLLEEQRRRIS
ncbi:MAG: hypothetical protein ACJA0H_001001 [Francisellaceae bacterium]|jgi:hypothetical protein